MDSTVLVKIGRAEDSELEMQPRNLLLDRFVIERPLGAGNMGEVFRARDPVSGEVVAIKVLADQRRHHTERFAREAELLAELSHPGIVRYISHGTMPDGRPYLVMEWLDGEDLRSRLRRGPLTMAEAVTLATRVAEALGTAHARGIVHRDLKPSNLFLPGGRIDQVKVLDFGIAHREGRSHLTRTGMIVGTPGYMAPEQARSRGVSDARADVFALGCVLFHCLTGRPAFEGDSAAAILAKILFEDTPRVGALWPDAPEDLDELVGRMLAKDPALRPRDGTQLATALAALGPLTHAAAVAPSGPGRRTRALTGGERQFLAVVMLGRAGEDERHEDAVHEDAALANAIRPFGGHLEELADGSAIVVLEADRQMATDQAGQAARCALALRALARGRPLAIAAGRSDGTSRRPAGDAIDHASRLLAPAAAGDASPIAVDEVIAGLLDARFDVVEHDTGLVLRGERELAHGARTLLGRPTSCVGRDWELGALAGILDNCIDEHEARVGIVTAPPGMGKSRLAAELVSRVRERGDVAIWIGRGDSLRAGSTLDLLAQALRSALGIHGGEPLADRRDRLRARVAEHVPAGDRKRVTEFLGELIGAPFPDDGDGGTSLRAARQDARIMSEQMRKVWLEFLRAETAARPVLLVLDDLHWGDFGTVQFIDAALREHGRQPWMVLALARPEVFDLFPRLWADRPSVQQIRLKELGRKAGERLVCQVLGDRVGADTMERLITQAEGNAFYLEELIRAVAEGKDRADALPETVLAMVETRLAGLPLEARHVLRAASVFGEVCRESGVATVLAGTMSAAAVGAWLARLVEQEVLAVRADRPLGGERELAFRHALLREGAYAMLTDEDRRLGHGLAGAWLEQRGEADPMVLAGHFERGGEAARAASYYLRAAEQAVSVLDVEAAIARVGQGLSCLPPPEIRIALLGIRCEASGISFRLDDAVMQDAEELLREAPRGSIPWAQALIAYIHGKMLAGRIVDVLAVVGLLHETEPAPGAMSKVVLSFLAGIGILDTVGRVAEANVLEERLTVLVEATGDREPLARLWWHVGLGVRASFAHEDPWRALAHSDAIQALYDAIGGEQIYLAMQLWRGLNLWYVGAVAQAEQILTEIAGGDTRLGLAGAWRRVGLALLHADRGALDEARAIATQLAESARAHGNPVDEARGRWALGEVLRRSGDLDGAERALEAALGMTAPIEQPGVLASLAQLRLAQGRAAEALAVAEDAVARSAAMGACGMFRGASVRLTHAEALHATGAHDAACHAIASARARLLVIADKIADPAYRRSFLEDVPENARTFELARAWLGEPG